ncbi:MAG: hypothetical protein JNL39_18075 [Opitutaceae bacterium]|nr:hypothetical protein [Opitutaceae bacterium]
MNQNKLLLAVAVAGAFGFASLFAAAADKERTLTGKATCAKCDLKQADACTNALIVSNKKGKSVTYILADNQVSKDFHGKVCSGAIEGVKVTGIVSKDGKKNILTAAKIETK